jgi:hypothetical protein
MNGVHNAVVDTPEPVVIREKLTRKILRPLMANFQNVSEAVLELVDNAFDEFDGIHGGTRLNVVITIRKNAIVVENLGGKGMAAEELDNWLEWGGIHKVDAIGEYGQGGKAAMGYLGKAWIVRVKRFDEPWLWTVTENNWADFASNEKTYEAVPTRSDPRLDGLGYCRFEIGNLEKRRQDINRLKAVLSNVYRKHLENGMTTITVNSEPVLPLALPLYEGVQIEQIKEKTCQGCSIKGWVGRLKRDLRARGGPRIVGGMRLLRKGRLICEGQYFGHPDFRHKASLGMLIGEVELIKVPVIPNKTGFDTDSKQWDEVQSVMYNVLKPYIEALLKQSEEETVTREERKRVAQVRRWMIDAIKLLGEQSDLHDWLGLDRGRKRPKKGRIEERETEREHVAPSEIKRDYKPRTPPPEGAVGRLRRLGIMPEWEPRPLGPSFRSDWEEKDKNRRLLINKNYCLYDERKGDDLYIAETAALQLARPQGNEQLTIKEYLDHVDLIMRAFCEVYNSAR